MRSGFGRHLEIVVYEILKPSGVELRLGRLPETAPVQKVRRAWIRLTRGRRFPLEFPDFTQEGGVVRFRPAEMTTAAGYEFELEEK